MDSDTRRDNKLLTETPHDGSRTPKFIKFKRDFQAGADAWFLHDDDYSIWSACDDSDQGGLKPGSDAMPGPNQNGYANCVRRRRRTTTT